jgi:GNAT superfamily N-acetyltransferase
MTEEIRQTESLSDEDNERFYDWGEDIFGTEELGLSWRPKDLHFMLYAHGELACHVGILKHSVSVEGTTLAVSGVGGVVTLPEFQKQGFARRLMERADEFFKTEWKVDAGLLFCLPKMEPYYGAMGWQRVEAPVTIEQPTGNVISPVGVMVLPLTREWPAGNIDLRSLPW